MPSCHVFIATSIDGLIAREDDDIDWLHLPGAEAEDHGYDAFIAGIDAIVMGRGSFDKVVTFDPWPYPLPVVVLSATMTDADIPDRLAGRVSVLDLPPWEVVAHCAARGWNRLYVDGGRVIQSFLRAGLIVDIVLTCIPVILGAGKPLFGALDRDIPLDHLETRAFPSGLTQSSYRVRR
ncbi:dihydrofolate reductase [Rhodobacterales bacterium HKCCE2091]|nr:dihydrofolate reductase [Rhodobacterales bacterium HKCCE2091]